MNRILTTLLAGVAIGILIAPEKGWVLRQRIAGFWEDLKEELREGLHLTESTIEDAAERVDSALHDKLVEN